jgi:hypothetical protein
MQHGYLLSLAGCDRLGYPAEMRTNQQRNTVRLLQNCCETGQLVVPTRYVRGGLTT